QRHVFTHTGWRDRAGQWFYLTAAGAIGLAGCEVDLGADLARYAVPTIADDPTSAMRVSLALLRLAPLRVTIPLWAATYRVALAPLSRSTPPCGSRGKRARSSPRWPPAFSHISEVSSGSPSPAPGAAPRTSLSGERFSSKTFCSLWTITRLGAPTRAI